MTLKTDANGQLLRTHPGITTFDIPLSEKAREKWDEVFGKRCIKHRDQVEPCPVCLEDEANGFIKHRTKKSPANTL